MRNTVIAFTGAGISAASGIPTFEEHPEIKEVLTAEILKRNPAVVEDAINKMKSFCKGKKPNDAHIALAEHDVPVITMNVDGLHLDAGTPYVIEIHGNLERDDVVLYGQDLLHLSDVYQLIDNHARDERKCFLIVGTSFKTQFARELETYALASGYWIKEINEDAEHEVRRFLEAWDSDPLSV